MKIKKKNDLKTNQFFTSVFLTKINTLPISLIEFLFLNYIKN